MSSRPRIIQVSPEHVPGDLAELQSAVEALPEAHRQSLLPLVRRVVEATQRRRRILGLVQDALGQLRLDLKYLMFDLEATRRERDEYRRQVEERS
jgi:hypothetical protein